MHQVVELAQQELIGCFFGHKVSKVFVGEWMEAIWELFLGFVPIAHLLVQY